eukprot:2107553-Rhodomonas_salina.1
MSPAYLDHPKDPVVTVLGHDRGKITRMTSQAPTALPGLGSSPAQAHRELQVACFACKRYAGTSEKPLATGPGALSQGELEL